MSAATWEQTTTAALIEGGLLEVGDGYRAKNSELSESGIPFLRVRNLLNGAFDFAVADKFPTAELFKVGRKVGQPGDSAIATKGTVGRAAYVGQNSPPFVYSPQVSYWRSMDWARLNPRFLYYWLQSREFVDQCQQLKTSTDMADYVNLRDQRRMRITLPGAAEQSQIATTLSAYDDLIENNTRRIAILEEMAQGIYREWFVNFRFPGHESVELVESEPGQIPEDWKVVDLLSISDVRYGHPFKSGLFNEEGDGTRVIRIRNVPKNQSSTFTTEHVDSKYEVRDGDILVGLDGEFHMCRWAGGHSYLNQRVARFRPAESIPSYFLFWALHGPVTHYNLTITGTTVAHLLARHIKEMRVLLPPDELIRSFDNATTTLYDLEISLRKSNTLLKTIRDLLLPRLVSGEIDVSELEIDTSELVA